MLSLTYLSSATQLWSDDELDALLRESREHNAEHGITGMLLYAGGNFIQTIEGPVEEVEALYSVIDEDPRHAGVYVVRRDELDSRQFGAWSMGFARISPQDAAAVDGYTDYLSTGRIDGEEPRRSAVATFHRVFRQNIH